MHVGTRQSCTIFHTTDRTLWLSLIIMLLGKMLYITVKIARSYLEMILFPRSHVGSDCDDCNITGYNLYPMG